MLRGHRDLKVYQLSYKLAMEIFHLSKAFPRKEIYSLTDQIRRSLRSVAANLAEGFRKRRYSNMLVSKLTDCDGEATETQVWPDFALDCGYLSKDHHDRLTEGYDLGLGKSNNNRQVKLLPYQFARQVMCFT